MSQNSHSIERYSFEKKGEILNIEPDLKASFEEKGMRLFVEGVLLTHDHGHPHILLFKNDTDRPGGILNPGEDEAQGLRTRLNRQLAVAPQPFEVGQVLGVWWRPHFEDKLYPYLPPHISKPKECKRVYLIHLPEKQLLYVPKNMSLLAIPLFDLYNNVAKYGPRLATLPLLLSRFDFQLE